MPRNEVNWSALGYGAHTGRKVSTASTFPPRHRTLDRVATRDQKCTNRFDVVVSFGGFRCLPVIQFVGSVMK